MLKLEMHSPPLKRSVTAPNNPGFATTKARDSFTTRNIPRHRSLSPNPRSRTHSNDSPRPSELLYHKSVLIGIPSSFSHSHSHSLSLEAGNVPSDSAPHSQVHEFESSSPMLHPQNLIRSDDHSSELHPPVVCTSGASGSSIGRVYISAETSTRSSEIQNTPRDEIAYDYLGVLQKPDYHSNTSSQSCLSFYVPPTFDTERMHVENGHSNSGTSGFALSESEKSEAQSRVSGYVMAEVQRGSRTFPEGGMLDLQFPILTTPDLQSLIEASSKLRIDPDHLKRKFLVENPDPLFHRSLNSPLQGELPDQVLVEQVGSFGVHHLRSDTLGQLPHITTIEALPLQSSPPVLSAKESLLGKITQLEVPPAVTSGEITPSTVVLPGEYFRRRHSGSHILSHGHRNFGLNLHIIDHVPSPSPKIVIGPRVSSDRPPNTPESPFTLVSREKTKVRGRRQNSPSSLITFLSAVSPIETYGVPGRSKLKPPGNSKVNSSGILLVTVSATTVICLVPAYGETHTLLTEIDSPAGLSNGM